MDKEQSQNYNINKNNKKIEISGKDFLKGTDFINSVIHEYLLKKEYYKALDIFQVNFELILQLLIRMKSAIKLNQIHTLSKNL